MQSVDWLLDVLSVENISEQAFPNMFNSPLKLL